MRMLGNILWHIPFLGFLNALFAFLFGSLLIVLIIPAPIGLGLVNFSKFLLMPFSYNMVSVKDLGIQQNPLWRAYSFIIMILYLPFGIIAFFCGLLQAVATAFTIIGIPVAIVIIKSLPTYFNPVGKKCVPIAAMYQGNPPRS